jgi:methyl-accepting chemotaxis protein
MSLRLKLLVALTPVLLGTLVALWVMNGRFIGDGFTRIEVEMAERDAARIADAVDAGLDTLGQLTRLQAVWDDPYEHLAGGDPAGLAEDFPPADMWESYRVGVVVAIDADGAVVGGGSTSAGDAFGPMPQELVDTDAIARYRSADAGACGLGRGLDVVWGWCAHPVLRTDGSGPPAGTVVLFQPIDDDAVATISQRLGIDLRIGEAGGEAVRPVDADTLEVTSTLAVGDDPAGLALTASMDRPVHRQADQTQRAVLFMCGAIGLAWVITMAILLESWVLRRTRRFSRLLAGVADSDDLTVRLPVRGGDELGELAGTVNDMLDGLGRREAEVRDARAAAESALGRAAADHRSAEAARNEAEASLRTAQELMGSAGSQVLGELDAMADESEQLRRATDAIGTLADDAATVTGQAVAAASAARSSAGELREAAGRIEEVVGFIRSLADQTNLLALNATIESARAGETGKGFAVVASEVKALALSTGESTASIASGIQEVWARMDAIERSIETIAELTGRIDGATAGIASSATDQAARTERVERSAATARERVGHIMALARDRTGHGGEPVDPGDAPVGTAWAPAADEWVGAGR